MTLKLTINTIKENQNTYEFTSSKYNKIIKEELEYRIITNKKCLIDINKNIGKKINFNILEVCKTDEYINYVGTIINEY